MTKEVAIITGAASGIGRHFAGALLEKGYRLTLTDLNFEALSRTFPTSDEVLTMPLDVRDAAQWEKVIKATLNRYQGIDYLFNIAGIIAPGFILETEMAQVDRHFDINTKGVVYGTKLVGEVMARQGNGHIINIASLAGLAPIKGISLYSASKFAVRGFSLAVSYELEAQNVQVSVLCPDLVDTPMMSLQLDYPQEAALSFSGARQPLTVADVEKALFKIMRDRPREFLLPAGRGWLSKLGNIFPGIGARLSSTLTKKGLRRLKKLKKEQLNP